MDEDFSPQRFAALFQDFLESLDSLVVREESALVGQLCDHLGQDLEAIPTVGEDLPSSEQPNLQLALDRLMRADVRVSMEPLTNMIEHSAPILRSILGAGHHDHPDDQYEWDDSGPEPPAWQATFDG